MDAFTARRAAKERARQEAALLAAIPFVFAEDPEDANIPDECAECGAPDFLTCPCGEKA